MVPVPSSKKADMLELIGFYNLKETRNEDPSKTLEYWTAAAQMRQEGGIHKPILGYTPPYATIIHQTSGTFTN